MSDTRILKLVVRPFAGHGNTPLPLWAFGRGHLFRQYRDGMLGTYVVLGQVVKGQTKVLRLDDGAKLSLPHSTQVCRVAIEDRPALRDAAIRDLDRPHAGL